ncbi:hypothetical protein JD79_02687 [Geodermatophilus normandii]|uniref:DUF732 domain-containing protein n=1 Tax=Geodermatophilus normandii TaxID=1137989 RepID=A0A317QKK9_9ACTN|nr:DUF732 domain-containing protein [Geodermatophilus normandii]PWW23513.1 hypothetical protein JD79_02687 [Geodermatophilus normandii]
MSQPTSESPIPAAPPSHLAAGEGGVPALPPGSEDAVAYGERTGTAVFAVPEPAPADGAARDRGRNRLVVALSAAVVLLLAAAGVLTALVVSARGEADALAAAEAAEDRQQAEELQAVRDERGQLEERISDAEAGAAAAERRIATAEAAQRAAEDASAAREQADADAAAADAQTFVDALRATETMTSATDAQLLQRGRDVCSYLDSTAGTPADLSDAFDRATATYAVDDAILLVTAATQILCPEYGS